MRTQKSFKVRLEYDGEADEAVEEGDAEEGPVEKEEGMREDVMRWKRDVMKMTQMPKKMRALKKRSTARQKMLKERRMMRCWTWGFQEPTTHAVVIRTVK